MFREKRHLLCNVLPPKTVISLAVPFSFYQRERVRERMAQGSSRQRHGGLSSDREKSRAELSGASTVRPNYGTVQYDINLAGARNGTRALFFQKIEPQLLVVTIHHGPRCCFFAS